MNKKILSFDNHADALSGIVSAVEARTVDLNVRHIVIVPEEHTLKCEQLFFCHSTAQKTVDLEECNATQKRGAFDVQVYSIKRLSALAGGGNYLPREGAIMLLRELVADMELSCFYRSKKFRGFCEKLYSVILSFMESGIAPSDVAKITKEEREGMAASSRIKLDDLQKIYSAFLLKTNGYSIDSAGRTLSLIESLKKNNLFADAHVYVAGFERFTKIEEELLRLIGQSALSFTLAVAKSERLILGKIEVYPAKGYVPALKAAARRMREAAYNGVAYRDMGLIIGEGFSRVRRILDEFDIPYYINERIPLQAHPLTRYLLCLFDLSRFTREGFIALSKSPYSGVSADQSDVFENYCNRFCIDYLGFSRPFTIEHSDLTVAESVRTILFGKVHNFFALLKSGRDGFFCAVQNALNAAADGAVENIRTEAPGGSGKTSKNIEDSRVFLPQTAIKKINELLALLQKTTVTGVDRLTEMLQEGISAATLGSLPPLNGSLQVGDAGLFCVSRLKYLFIVGFNEGILPAAMQESGILTDSETVQISKDIPTSEDSLQLVSDRLMGVISQSKNVFISYNLSDRPSPLLYEVERVPHFVTGEEYDQSILEGADNLSLLDGDGSAGDAMRQKLAALVACRGSGAEILITTADNPTVLTGTLYGLIGKETDKYLKNPYEHPSLTAPDALIMAKDGEISASRLQTYFTCPYKHFISYALRPTPRDKGEIQPLDIGSVIHKIAEDFAACGFNGDKLSGIIEYHLSQGKYAYAQNKNITDRIKNEADKLCRILASRLTAGKMRRLGTEIRLSGGKLKSVNIGGYTLSGSVDYADCYDGYVRIVDYKTGYINAAEFKRDLFYGIKLQLALYMQAFIENGYSPAAMVYFRFSDRFLSKNILEGMYNSEQDVLKIMESDFESESKLYTARVGRGGKICGVGASGEDELRMLCSYAKEVSAQAVAEINGGYISPRPLGDDICSYCAYVPACGGGNPRNPVKCRFDGIPAEKDSEQ